MKSSKIILLSSIAILVMSSVAFAHVEAEFFLPQVADPAAMTIDGDEGDWGWYDRSFAHIPERYFDASLNDGYTKEDFDFVFLGLVGDHSAVLPNDLGANAREQSRK